MSRQTATRYYQQKSSGTLIAGGLLQRKCACGNHTMAGGECAECGKKKQALQRASHSPRGEADSLTTSFLPGGERVEGEGYVPPIVYEVLRSTGEPLGASTRAFMEPRFGHDFSVVQTRAPVFANAPTGLCVGAPHDRLEREAEAFSDRITRVPSNSRIERFDLSQVRVHTDARAAKSARAINAYAYTIGRNVVFDTGQYAPNTQRGARLLAHELAHVVQQKAMGHPCLIQRQGMGELRLAEAIDDLIERIRATPAYRAVDAANMALAEEIITELRKRSRPDQYHFLSKLKLLFDTPVRPPAVISTETQVSTRTAAVAERARLARPAEARRTGLEETASAAPRRAWVAIPGRFGGGTYYVDRTSPINIVVKADILLTPTGTGTSNDVDAIKGMEDGIEKAASTRGYLMDVRFVERAGPDTFRVDVDPSRWETATNWSGGDPLGFAHELHHMFAFNLDRYNYIEAHAGNESMEISDRLYWFREELKKPANYNDSTSIMNSAAHPNDNDACRVAGLDVRTCVPARAAARRAGRR